MKFTSVGVSQYSSILSTATKLVSSSLVIRIIQFSLLVICKYKELCHSIIIIQNRSGGLSCERSCVRIKKFDWTVVYVQESLLYFPLSAEKVAQQSKRPTFRLLSSSPNFPHVFLIQNLKGII